MKLLSILILLLILTNCKTTKKSFTGSIQFSIKYLPLENSTEDVSILEELFGDGLLMAYKENGDFTRTHLNGSSFDHHIQLYDAQAGRLLFKNKDFNIVDSLDATVNSLELKSVKKIDNEVILNLNCECYEYLTYSREINQNIKLNFCYSPKTPYLDYRLYKNHIEYFLADLYKKAKRPYLKFSMETEEYLRVDIATAILSDSE